MMTIEEIKELEKIAQANDGHCDRCHRTIKFYRYSLNRTLALFIRRVAEEVKLSGKNNIDIGALGLPYSIQSQMAKARQHGLIARIKDDRGVQIQRHWLITHKGWAWLNGEPQPKKVIVFNNQVLGHDGPGITIYMALGERPDPKAPVYEETPVSQAEARTYDDVRKPKKLIKVRAIYRGSRYHSKLKIGEIYDLAVEKLQVGMPVKISEPEEVEYKDIAAFQRDWKAV